MVGERAARAGRAATATLADVIVGGRGRDVFFVMGYIVRAVPRRRRQRAEQLVAELEASREAQAQAVALRERARLAREMHDVLAHSLSALAVQLEGTRLLARSAAPTRRWSTRSSAATASPRAGLEEARRAIEALRGGDMPGPDRLPALAEAFREQTGVDCDARVRRRAARAPLGGAARRVPHGAGGADQRAPPRAPPTASSCACATADDGTRLVVEDPRRRRAAADGPRRRLGYGLTGMRERAELLGGRLAAAPTPDGFRVELFIPA